MPLEPDGAAEIAGRSRGTPRVANRLLRRVRDFAEVRGNGVVDLATAQAALDGLRGRRSRAGPARPGGARALVRRFGGGPVGLGTLAVAVGEERETVEEVAEPFLVRAGLLAGPRAAGSRPRRPGSIWAWRSPPGGAAHASLFDPDRSPTQTE